MFYFWANWKETQLSWKKTKKERPEKKKKKNPFDSLLTYYDWEVKTIVGYLPGWLEELELQVLILVSKTNWELDLIFGIGSRTRNDIFEKKIEK